MESRATLEAQTTTLLLAWLEQCRQPVDLGYKTIPARVEDTLAHPEWSSPCDQLLRHALRIEQADNRPPNDYDTLAVTGIRKELKEECCMLAAVLEILVLKDSTAARYDLGRLLHRIQSTLAT